MGVETNTALGLNLRCASGAIGGAATGRLE
jgi:hypothetical protein